MHGTGHNAVTVALVSLVVALGSVACGSSTANHTATIGTAASKSTLAAPSTTVRPTPQADANSSIVADATATTLLATPVVGSRPFATVGDYLRWLAARPGVSSVSAKGGLPTGGPARLQIIIAGTNGKQSSAVCELGAVSSPTAIPQSAGQSLWFTCPQLAVVGHFRFSSDPAAP